MRILSDVQTHVCFQLRYRVAVHHILLACPWNGQRDSGGLALTDPEQTVGYKCLEECKFGP